MAERTRENGTREYIQFIITHPLNKDRPASTLLGPPLTVEEITNTLLPVVDNVDASHLEPVSQIYRVTDGLKTLESDGLPLKDLWLIPGYYLMSLKEAVKTMSTMKQVSGVWKPSWLPLFSSRAGDFIVYDTQNGHVYKIFLKESLGSDMAASINEFLKELVQKFKNDIIVIDDDGLLHDTLWKDEVSGAKPQDHFNLHVNRISEGINLHDSVNTPSIDRRFLVVKNLIFSCTNMPHVCQNIKNAITNNGKPQTLRRITDTNQISTNRRLACGNVSCRSGDSCDEYPFASTAQGGTGATTLCVPLSENNSQGGQLSSFYTRQSVGNGDTFHVQTPP
ncbi:hypothetical protein CHS0354_030203 [Potamilus streckersoni]|uniref:Deoxyribonuclease NucA/NucB domain-containing protein n=1 Tax=Potamilus streckersoni TaxID=2493646 RepID=A0AAE0RSG2_9BIVA|nr:hypothetical protein CHS0354_030203 [Potamilus streckersoni]